jgi:hypothetical protein
MARSFYLLHIVNIVTDAQALPYLPGTGVSFLGCKAPWRRRRPVGIICSCSRRQEGGTALRIPLTPPRGVGLNEWSPGSSVMPVVISF